jgi:outer membrane biosynthesis protein TonB
VSVRSLGAASNGSEIYLIKLLLLFCLIWSFTVQAQSSGNSYSAPGMPLHLQHGVPVVPARSIRKTAAAERLHSVPKASPILARFWHETDSGARQAGYAQFIRTIQHLTKYPVPALRAQTEGRIFVRAIISADGIPAKIEVVKRNMTAGASEESLSLLDAESIRVIKSMKFEPKANGADTVTVPMGYFIQ